MAEKNIEVGDEVSWKWSGGRPGGTVAEVAEHGEIAIQSNKGNTIKKNADPENPAVHIARQGNDVVKRASELDVEKKNDGGTGGGEENGDSEAKDDTAEKAHEVGQKGGRKIEVTVANGEKTDDGDAQNAGHEDGKGESKDGVTEVSANKAESGSKSTKATNKRKRASGDGAENTAKPTKRAPGRPKVDSKNGDVTKPSNKGSTRTKNTATPSKNLRRSARNRK